jgi:ankyrin repeat protein
MENAHEMIAAMQAGDADRIRQMLAETPALAGARDQNGVSAIMHALYRQRPDLAELLAGSRADLDIFEATALGRTSRVLELLRALPALVAGCSGDGFTALHFAAFFHQEAAGRLLIEHGADVNAVANNAMQVQPLHSAAAARNPAMARALLERGANPNARQHGGWTPLHSAAQNGDVETLKLLLAHGADPALANDEGTTAVQLAREKSHAQAAALLEERR